MSEVSELCRELRETEGKWIVQVWSRSELTTPSYEHNDGKQSETDRQTGTQKQNIREE